MREEKVIYQIIYKIQKYAGINSILKNALAFPICLSSIILHSFLHLNCIIILSIVCKYLYCHTVVKA
jgi:hypothetical protein